MNHLPVAVLRPATVTMQIEPRPYPSLRGSSPTKVNRSDLRFRPQQRSGTRFAAWAVPRRITEVLLSAFCTTRRSESVRCLGQPRPMPGNAGSVRPGLHEHCRGPPIESPTPRTSATYGDRSVHHYVWIRPSVDTLNTVTELGSPHWTACHLLVRRDTRSCGRSHDHLWFPLADSYDCPSPRHGCTARRGRVLGDSFLEIPCLGDSLLGDSPFGDSPFGDSH